MGCNPTRNKSVSINSKIVKGKLNSDSIDKEKEISKTVHFNNNVIKYDVDPYGIYEEILFLGKGSNGSVYKVINTQTSKLRAMRVVSRNKEINLKKNSEIDDEFIKLKDFDHINLIKVFEMYYYEDYVYFIYELFNGVTLTSKLEADGIFDEKNGSNILHQLLSVIKYLHSKNYTHKNLNLDNIMINEDNLIKIVDINSSQVLHKYKTNKCDIVGTPLFFSPELISSNKKYKKEHIFERADIWACGVISYILLTGELPFFDENGEVLVNSIIEGNFNKTNDEYMSLSEMAKDFISNLLDPNYNTRVSADVAVNHDFLVKRYTTPRKTITETKLKKIANKIKKNISNEKILIKTVKDYIVNNLMSEDELNYFKNIFQELNTTKDGQLTRDQLIKGYSNIMDKDELEYFVNSVFDNLDDDRNGYIEIYEFAAGSLDKKRFFTDQNIDILFKYLSNNSKEKTIKYIDLKKMLLKDNIKNGNLTANEEEEIIEKAIKEFDENSDGEITYDEFYKVLKREAEQNDYSKSDFSIIY